VAILQMMVVILVSAPYSDQCGAVLKEHRASIFGVTELVQLDGDVM
jgi:hypothetical protein